MKSIETQQAEVRAVHRANGAVDAFDHPDDRQAYLGTHTVPVLELLRTALIARHAAPDVVRDVALVINQKGETCQ